MYHLVSAALDPFLCCHLLTAGVLAWFWLRRPAARRMLAWIAVPFAGLTLACTPAVAFLGQRSLEWAYPPCVERPADCEAIVILGGYVRPPDQLRPAAELGEDTLYRCLLGAQLYHGGSPCPVIVSGGKVFPREPGPTLAAAMAEFLVDLSVPRQQIVLEQSSRSTHENAVETSRLLRERGIDRVVLVTDARHLRRAEACFQIEGVAVVPRGARHGPTEFEWSLRTFQPSGAAAESLRSVLHEWFGLAWYRLRGWI